MDSLDALRIRHRRELAVERETKERLKRKMDELVEYTAKVEEERDEMRECVTALIEKGEYYVHLARACSCFEYVCALFLILITVHL